MHLFRDIVIPIILGILSAVFIIVVGFCLAMLFGGCQSIPSQSNHKIVRVTFYHRFEDRWGAKVAMSSKMRAREGVTLAAPPNYPFGMQLHLPQVAKALHKLDDIFQVQDRGTDVTKGKASSGHEDVLDVYLYCRNKREGSNRVKFFSQQVGDYTDVYF
jgi:hypothetical protein